MTTIDSLTDAASAADIRELPIPPYRSATLPAIDYDAHPAYGGFLPKPTLRERIHAMNVFLRTFAFVTLRRIVDYENMPLLTKETGFKGLNFSTALRFMSMYATIRASRLLRTLTGQRRPAIPANPALLNKLKSDGIVCLSLKPDEIDAIRAATLPPRLPSSTNVAPTFRWRSASSTTMSTGARIPPTRRPSRPSRRSSAAMTSRRRPAPISAARSA